MIKALKMVVAVSFIMLMTCCVKHNRVPPIRCNDCMIDTGVGFYAKVDEFEEWLLKSKRNQMIALRDSRSIDEPFGLGGKAEKEAVSLEQEGEESFLLVNELAYFFLAEAYGMEAFNYRSERVEKQKRIKEMIQKIKQSKKQHRLQSDH